MAASTTNSNLNDNPERTDSSVLSLKISSSLNQNIKNSQTMPGLEKNEIMKNPSVLFAARKWRQLQEKAVNWRLSSIRYEKKQRDLQVKKEVTTLVSRVVPCDILTKDWFSKEKLPTDLRIYLVEKLIPTLVLGLEKVLTEARKHELIETDEPSAQFNPINFLAQFLMRNNPKYSNLSLTSPYAKTLKALLEELKRNVYNQDENRLAKLKAEAQQRRLERQRNDRMNFLAKKGRAEALQEMFLEWAEERNAVVSLSLVQSALKSFGDFLEKISSHSIILEDLDMDEADVSGKMVGMREYVEYVGKYTASFREETFAAFLKHMSNLAQEYRFSAELETIRTILTNLFIACDHGGAGLLDRQRIIKLLETFYQNVNDPDIKASLRNPKRWPVVEIGEEEEYDDGSDTDTEIFKVTGEEKEMFETKDGDNICDEATAEQKLDNDKQEVESSFGMEQLEVKHEELKEKETDVSEVKDSSIDLVANDNGHPEEAVVMENTSKVTTTEENNNITQDINTGDEAEKNIQNDELSTVQQPSEENVEKEGSVEGMVAPEEKQCDTETSTSNVDAEATGSSDVINMADEKQNVAQEHENKEKTQHDVTNLLSISNELEKEIRDIIESRSLSESVSSPSKSRAQSFTTGSAFDPHSLNQVQFCNLIIKFLGEAPRRDAIEAIVRYLRAGYRETEEEKMERLARARLEARSAKRRRMVDQLFDIWDIDGSGFLELSEVELVLSKWREDGEDTFQKVRDILEEKLTRLSRRAFHKLIRSIVAEFPDEDCFEPLVAFLTTSVERSFEERKRGEFRQKLLLAIDTSSQTSGALLEPVFKTAFQGLLKDSELHGKNKKLSCYIAMLERNEDLRTIHRGSTFLRYVACTQEDTNFVLNKILHRDMSNVSFAAVDSGKPIHVPRVLNNGGVHLWNPVRRDECIEGSFIVLPLKDHDKQVVGVLGIDTMSDPHEKAIFVTHEISFYQGVAKALSAATQFVDMRRKTIKIAESAVSWILRRSPNVHEVNIYLVEPGLKASDGLVLRKMVTIGHSNHEKYFEKPPRLERKDNLFRDYLFKCIDTSETLTADAYGERHLAFPLRDADGIAVAIVDISIGKLRQLPPHESKEIHRMLKLLAIAHKEVTREVAGEEKNMVLEVEKEHEEQRIDVLFDRIMLQDLRDNVGRLDARAFAEIKSYKDPPKIVHDILKAVLGIYFTSRQSNDDLEEKFEEWTSCKQLVNSDLVAWISTFDPTAGENLAVDGERLSQHLSSVPTGTVAKHGSLPAQHLFNWAFVCLSLIEHTAKMRETRVKASAIGSRHDTGDPPPETKGRASSVTSGLSK